MGSKRAFQDSALGTHVVTPVCALGFDLLGMITELGGLLRGRVGMPGVGWRSFLD